MKLSKFKIVYASFLIAFFVIFLGFVFNNLNNKKINNSLKEDYKVIASQNIEYVPLSKRKSSIIYEVTSADISSINKEKNTLLFFLTSWCPHCIEEIEDLKKAQVESEDVNYIVVSHDQNKEDMLKLLKDYDANFFVLWDPNKYIRTKLNSEDHTVPGAYLLDKEKNIIEINKDTLTYDSILNMVKRK